MATARAKILIVDDEPDLLEITAAYLDMEGYEALTALSGAAAVEILKTTTPDLIISDITMPGMSGFDLFEKIRADSTFENTPFVFLSGHTDLEHIMIGKELGSDDYLMKPYEPEMLISTIKGKLKRRQQISDSMSQHIDTLKNQLFRIISHEMRTPLTSILGATEILSADKESLSPEDFKGFLEMLKTGTLRLNKLVEDFLLVVKIESGETAKEVESMPSLFSPMRVISDMLPAYDEVKKTKNLAVEVQVPQKTLSLAIHLQHFENIMSRLLDNAFKFSPERGTVRVVAREEKARLIVSVGDSGVGIPKDKQDGLFQKFYQVNRELQEQQGAGLGLYVAKKLAEMNKCDLRCESEQGKGAVFSLYIRIQT